MTLKIYPKIALLVVDMQKYFLESQAGAYLKDGPSIIPNVLCLIKTFRNAGNNIIYTRHAHHRQAPPGQMGRWWNEKLPWDGSPESELIDELKPLKNEPVITKTHYSAFVQTILETHLNQADVKTVVFCGVMTHLCVETTARHAFMLDFQPIIVSDACASDAKDRHNAALLNLAHGFAYIVKTDELINHGL